MAPGNIILCFLLPLIVSYLILDTAIGSGHQAQGFEGREQLASSTKLMNVGGADHDIKDDVKALSIVVLGASGTFFFAKYFVRAAKRNFSVCAPEKPPSPCLLLYLHLNIHLQCMPLLLLRLRLRLLFRISNMLNENSCAWKEQQKPQTVVMTPN
jgi:hypothetical protein